ncbi:VLRF1 family aeRF1-type release factor [Actinoplanes oblitus]|uniref:VLRF1 family aeRF1-type release factor n=1 Tax=Actinoplanes oblitus TaxID=3040509 RepID=A0ABY8W4Y3_9ACTN|nr:VLRF1 family aeRF1-type release factor [Actinoplanes oblitus]WIM92875.1 VLRF1 family aeRF1-type release factor [Actinoplanes oblitus]
MSVIRAEDLHDLACLHDPTGVLSVYVTVGPHGETAVPAPWQVGVPHLLAELGRRAPATLRHRLDLLEPELKTLLDITTVGRGRALFATVDGGDIRLMRVQSALTDTVRFGESAYLGPLAAAYSQASPAGIVAVSGHGVRVVDYRLGQAEQVGAADYRPGTPPRASNRRGGAQRDRQDRRWTVHLERFLTASGSGLARLGARPDWEHLLVTGDTDLVAAFVARLPHLPHTEVLTAHHVVAAGLPVPRIAALVATELRVAREDTHVRLAVTARDTAHAGGAATAGPGDTARAAAQGRIRRLLLDGSARHGTGTDLAELLIERTYRAGGAVTLVGGTAAQSLAGCGGVAALLHP